MYKFVQMCRLIWVITCTLDTLSDGVTVVLYNVMQVYNRMDTVEADQVQTQCSTLELQIGRSNGYNFGDNFPN